MSHQTKLSAGQAISYCLSRCCFLDILTSFMRAVVIS